MNLFGFFNFKKNRFTFGSTLNLHLMKTVTLTARQRQVLLLLACGLTEAQIADKLHISEHTVHTHLKKHSQSAESPLTDRTYWQGSVLRMPYAARLVLGTGQQQFALTKIP